MEISTVSDLHSSISMEAGSNTPTDPLDRDKIKELRKIRNKLKRERRRALKPPQPLSNNNLALTNGPVGIVTQSFMQQYNSPQCSNNKRPELFVNIAEIANKKSFQPNNLVKSSSVKSDSNLVKGVVPNRLDNAQPVLVKGKHSETKKTKKMTKLKKEIFNTNNQESRYDYRNNLINESFETISSNFIREIVALQEKYFAKEPTKAAIKRRYIVGFHQLKKYLIIRKIRVFFIAIDVKVTQNDPLDLLIKEIINLAEQNEIEYAFVLKRRQLGRLSMKNVPVSCLAVLNYDGVNEIYKALLVEIKRSKSEFEKMKVQTDREQDVYSGFLKKFKDELNI